MNTLHQHDDACTIYDVLNLLVPVHAHEHHIATPVSDEYIDILLVASVVSGGFARIRASSAFIQASIRQGQLPRLCVRDGTPLLMGS